MSAQQGEHFKDGVLLFAEFSGIDVPSHCISELADAMIQEGVISTASVRHISACDHAGWTWQSTKRTTSRIDSVCCDAALVDVVQDCRVVDEVDLGMLMMTKQVHICGKEQKRARTIQQPGELSNGTCGAAPMKPWISALTWFCDCSRR